ncbi:transporter substrate-binding domain-containing protein [Paraburkholderia nemoris]|uniref:Histidine-binding protein n=1 Tax=Paraburkholderia nemoris TaxID=2793076 RepID=A0ABM8RE70_9BURK|nr:MULTISPECIES: transporter substrate-binding domain-containing protein [Paraburkholderia]KPD18883.1 amino acid ABC transporter substrate-binding protein [Burkholderia sp. ST111]MBK5148175.1 transporter substrate-binding domain-containing protein [Burkholderia sp. R-69608]MBK3742348.1 transporter substrate-binding domain-containing protein [Paraburkholderia aspalathi]MBK3811179.1 transporter substrate-binding domain-containing protein [Paraburkholderia aspalathi]CAE6747774.1 putative histidin
MKVRIAYLEEPPFYWTDEDHSATGADIELAEVVLRAIGVTSIEHQLTSFEELLPGVQEGRWDMNVPIFVTAERAERVAFSVPVWALGDGFLLRQGNPKALTSYATVAARNDARLGIVAGTVQLDSAKSVGVRDSQIVAFKGQTEAIDALLAGKIDAYASTAVGSRVLASANQELEVVAHETSKDGRAPVGAFSFSKNNPDLLRAVNEQLRKYLGSADHRARMAKYGLTQTELDSVSAT